MPWTRLYEGRKLPTHVYKKTPREVFDCIVAQLEQLHLDQDQACASCYLDNLHSLSLASRAWGEAATAVLYRKVLVLANTSERAAAYPRLKINGTSRLKLLRRTLRENSMLADMVKELHVSDFQTLYHDATIEQEEIVNLVASLVMACPRLERLVGFHVPFSAAFDRLSHALSTRPNLRERAWMLGDADHDVNDEDEHEMRGLYIAECDPTEHFLSLNSNHPMLSTLVLHQGAGNNLSHLNFRAIVGTLRSFPQLSHLSISGLPASSFTNLVLNALPANLRSLRLENLPGVTEKGISRFVTSPQAVSLQKLSLINLEIRSVLTLADIFSAHLAGLEEFSLVQDKAPTLPGNHLTPTFHSPSLRYLHWELRSEDSPLPALTFLSSGEYPESQAPASENLELSCCVGTYILAASIRNNGFPLLSSIRIPHDPQGTIQSLCRPLSSALLQSDMVKLSEELISGSSHGDGASICTGMSTARVDSVVDSPVFSPSTPDAILGPMRSRLAAQSRILAARKEPGMAVRVIDPEGEVCVNKVFGSYVGHVGSNITYELRPQRWVVRQNAWMTEMEAVAGCRAADNTHDGLAATWRPCGHLVGAGVDGRAVSVDNLF